MPNEFSRRSLLKWAPLAVPIGWSGFQPRTLGIALTEKDDSQNRALITDIFPTQPAELTREMVTVAHFDLRRVKELVEARPSLAKASWDWGFGDWESALGAASHVGNRPIADYLISKGARPSLFSAAMMGQLEVIKAFVAAQPGVQRIRGPHSISLLAHAQAGGEAAQPVLEFLKSLGDADAEPPVPLSDAEMSALTGTYAFGLSANHQIDVTVDKRPGAASVQTFLTWTRKGTSGRRLTYLGDRSFHPAGAPAVRIRFDDTNPSGVMTVYDPDVILVARRVQEAK
jgi:hypothetical protein